MTAPTLFDGLRETMHRGDLIGTDPAEWCPMYAEQMDQWSEMGGVPADLSTVDAAVRIGLALWRKHKALLAEIEDLL